MIAVHGATVVHLGGPRGDRLSLGREGEPVRKIADLGWDARTQTTPQRRFRLEAESVLVLEPVRGPLLLPPLRVRRFDLQGRETDVQEGADPGDPDLHFHAERDGRGALRVRRCGIDPRDGRPLLWEGTLPVDLATRPASGTPLRRDGTWWYPVREVGVVRVGPEGVTVLRGAAGRSAEEVRGRAVCPARKGAWVDGAWRPVRGGPLFPPWRFPPGGVAAAAPDGGIALLRREGGTVPVLDGAPGRLPPGLYGGLALLGARLHATAELGPLRLVPVEF